jgi:hypothetical protein
MSITLQLDRQTNKLLSEEINQEILITEENDLFIDED